jgi:hypothetical protein
VTQRAVAALPRWAGLVALRPAEHPGDHVHVWTEGPVEVLPRGSDNGSEQDVALGDDDDVA